MVDMREFNRPTEFSPYIGALRDGPACQLWFVKLDVASLPGDVSGAADEKRVGTSQGLLGNFGIWSTDRKCFTDNLVPILAVTRGKQKVKKQTMLRSRMPTAIEIPLSL